MHYLGKADWLVCRRLYAGLLKKRKPAIGKINFKRNVNNISKTAKPQTFLFKTLVSTKIMTMIKLTIMTFVNNIQYYISTLWDIFFLCRHG